MKSLEDYLLANAKMHPDKIAISCGNRSITYDELADMSLRRSEGIKEEIDSNANVIRSSQSIEFLVEYFATHLCGKAAVPLEQDIPISDYEEIKRQVECATIPADVSDILYTTGTTGKRKGTMLSHDAIIADAENLIDAQGFSHDLNFIIAGPLNHIGSLSKIWPCIMLGATVTVLEGMKDMNLFFETVRNSSEKTATFLVPASIRMLLQFGRSQLESIKDNIDFIETGAAPISQSDMESLCALLPHTRLYNTYASTETGIICTHDYNSDICVAGCLGKVMKNSDLSIDEDGLISCGGRTLMSGYLGDEALTSEVIKDNRVYTQDIGRLDENGRLHLTGRKGDIINVGGFKINPVDVENVAKGYPGIIDCICIPDRHPVLGTAMRLLYESDRDINRKELGLYLVNNLERHKVPQFFSQVQRINRTYNGKLDRKSYLQV